MKKRKIKTKYLSQLAWPSILLVVTLFISIMAGTAGAATFVDRPYSTDNQPSLFLVARHEYSTDALKDYTIASNGTPTGSHLSDAARTGGAGVTIDQDNGYFFVSGENTYIDVYDVDTMDCVESLNTGIQIAGVAYDHSRDKLYAMNRATNKLYIFDWNGTDTLSADDPAYVELGDIGKAIDDGFGIALDETNDRLYIACSGSSEMDVICVDPDDSWNVLCDYCYNLSDESAVAIGIAVDVKNQYVYTGESFYGRTNDLTKCVLSSKSQSTVDVGADVHGITVWDSSEGNATVYVTVNHKLRWYNSSLTYQGESTTDLAKPCGLDILNEGYERADINPVTHDWNDYDSTAHFWTLDGSDKVDIESIKFVYVKRDFDPNHCHTITGTDVLLEHYHFEDDVTALAADRYWNWYYDTGTTSIAKNSGATNDQESIAYAMHEYADDGVNYAEYNYWLVHGTGDNQANKAFTKDCDEVTPTSNVAVDDRLAYEGTESPYNAADVIEQATLVSAVTSSKPTQITWKCEYSGVYTWDNSGQADQWATPGRTGCAGTQGNSPTGTWDVDYWASPDVYQKK